MQLYRLVEFRGGGILDKAYRGIRLIERQVFDRVGGPIVSLAVFWHLSIIRGLVPNVDAHAAGGAHHHLHRGFNIVRVQVCKFYLRDLSHLVPRDRRDSFRPHV